MSPIIPNLSKNYAILTSPPEYQPNTKLLNFWNKI